MSDLASATCTIHYRRWLPRPKTQHPSSSFPVHTIPQLPLPSRSSARTRSTKKRAHHKSPAPASPPSFPILQLSFAPPRTPPLRHRSTSPGLDVAGRGKIKDASSLAYVRHLPEASKITGAAKRGVRTQRYFPLVLHYGIADGALGTDVRWWFGKRVRGLVRGDRIRALR